MPHLHLILNKLAVSPGSMAIEPFVFVVTAWQWR